MHYQADTLVARGEHMTLDEYQTQAATTSLMQDNDKLFVYTALGMNGEAGEIAEKVKKILRDKDGDRTQIDRADIIKELGDVLWYVAMFAKSLDVSLDEVATANVEKLASRKDRGVIHGSGDNR